MSAGEAEATRWFPDSMPMPAASAETIEWWQAAAEHRLVIQVCQSCDRPRHPPAPLCPACRSWTWRWEEHPGTGTIYTCTKVHQAFIPGVDLPLVVAVIDLDGFADTDPPIRLVTNVVDADPGEVTIGGRVELVWEDMGPDLALPRAHLVP